MPAATAPAARGSAAASAAPLLAVSGLCKAFGQRAAVSQISLELAPGEILGFVGPNGAGKTTTMRMLAGLLKPDAGEGQVLGCDLGGVHRAIAAQVGYMPQRLALYGDLSVVGNLRFRAEVYGLADPRAAVEAALVEFGLAERRAERAERLSGGWARRLQFAATLIHRPRLVLLDEPTAGLDAASRHEMWRRIGRLAGAGAGVIINTHDLGEAEQCDRVCMFAGGRVLASGAPEAISAGLGLVVLLVSGAAVHDLAETLCGLAGVTACYPQGQRLRVLLAPGAAASVSAAAVRAGAVAEPAAWRFEDAALSLANRGPAP
ncbi:MAG: ABC transporter ATP-binding protein [Phenylobacterium sp.]